MPSRTTPAVLPSDLQLKRIVSLAQAAELSGLSVDTLKRRYAEKKIISLSPRRKGMRVSDALLMTGAV